MTTAPILSASATARSFLFDSPSVAYFPASPASVGQARLHTAAWVQAMGFDDLVDTSTLLVSELATNAIHATAQTAPQSAGEAQARAPERIAMRLSATPANLVIEVWDRVPTRPARRAHDLTAENGRGLLLIESLSRESGVYVPRTGGKVVWVALALRPRSFRGDRTVSEGQLLRATDAVRLRRRWPDGAVDGP